jgi:hypothetical protein
VHPFALKFNSNVLFFTLFLLAGSLVAQPLPQVLQQFLPVTGGPVVAKASSTLAALTSGQPRPYGFSFTQSEATEYLKDAIRANPGCGLSNPIVKFFPGNYVSLYFDMDFDQFVRFRPSWTSRLRRLPIRGKHSVWVDGRFWTGDGVFTAKAEKVRVDGLYVSPTLLNLAVRFLARWKDGRLNVVRGIPMPWGLKRLATTSASLSGQA